MTELEKSVAWAARFTALVAQIETVLSDAEAHLARAEEQKTGRFDKDSFDAESFAALRELVANLAKGHARALSLARKIGKLRGESRTDPLLFPR